MDLLIRLDNIIQLLEQINGITINQTTIILEESIEKENETQIDEVLEEMISYKAQIINEVEKLEIEFEEAYNLTKASITNKETIEELKYKVGKVLEIKRIILENEKTNMITMQSRIRQQNKVFTIPKDPQKVIQSYKNNDIKRNSLNIPQQKC